MDLFEHAERRKRGNRVWSFWEENTRNGGKCCSTCRDSEELTRGGKKSAVVRVAGKNWMKSRHEAEGKVSGYVPVGRGRMGYSGRKEPDKWKSTGKYDIIEKQWDGASWLLT